MPRRSLTSGNGIVQVPAEEFSLYHVSPSSQSTSIKALNGPTVIIITSAPSSGASITEQKDGNDQAAEVEVKKGQVYLIGAGTGVKFGEGVEVWGAFWDDQEMGQTETR